MICPAAVYHRHAADRAETRLLDCEARVADLGPVRVSDLFDDRRELIVRAYDPDLGMTDVIVAQPRK
jgi:hypothetical protein